jgi:hypothetical protein
LGSFGKKHIFQAINVKRCAYKQATVSDPSDLALFGKTLLFDIISGEYSSAFLNRAYFTPINIGNVFQ